MEHLLTVWSKIRGSLEGRAILLLLDFDGTLAPIALRPSEAVLPQRTRGLLRRLEGKDWCSVAIISGRTLRNLKGKVRLDGVIYGGNHGAHLSGPGIDFHAPLTETTFVVQKIASRLDFLRSSIRGIIIENKGESLTVHYRAVDEGRAAAVPDLVAGTVAPFLATGLVEVKTGKKVVDITPRSWDKGMAVMWLIDHLRSTNLKNCAALPVYVGDDTTDEDAFAAIGERGLTVVVGRNTPSRARYYLKDTNEVYKFLIYLLVAGRPSVDSVRKRAEERKVPVTSREQRKN